MINKSNGGFQLVILYCLTANYQTSRVREINSYRVFLNTSLVRLQIVGHLNHVTQLVNFLDVLQLITLL